MTIDGWARVQSLIQALGCLGMAFIFYSRAPTLSAALVVCAMAQLNWCVRREGRLWAGALGLLVVAWVFGLYAQVYWWVSALYSPVLVTAFGTFIVPFVSAVVLSLCLYGWQLSINRRVAALTSASSLLLVGGLLLQVDRELQPSRRFEAIDGPLVSKWIYNRVAGGERWLFPTGDFPVELVLTAVHRGEIVGTETLKGATLPEALRGIKARVRGGEFALYLDSLRETRSVWRLPLAEDGVVFIPPAAQGLSSASRGLSTFEVRRAKASGLYEIAPGLRVPGWRVTGLPEPIVSSYVADSWVYSRRQGAAALRDGWTVAPAISPLALQGGAYSAARFLTRHLGKGGRLPEVVVAPEGRPSRAYESVVAAGGALLMARVARQMAEPVYREAAERALSYLASDSVYSSSLSGLSLAVIQRDDDRFSGPGATAVALVATLELGQPLSEVARSWLNYLVSWADKAVVGPSGDGVQQSQVLWALSAAASNDPRAAEAARSLSDVLRFKPTRSPDEAWSCLAALSVQRNLQVEPSLARCDYYLKTTSRTIALNGGLADDALSLGRLFEAQVARAAVDSPSSVAQRERLERTTRQILQSMYRPSDAPLLPRPRALIGGFRQRAWRPNVRVDAVQHIGNGLLELNFLLAQNKQFFSSGD